MVVHVCDFSIENHEAGASQQVQGQPGLQIQFQVSLEYMVDPVSKRDTPPPINALEMVMALNAVGTAVLVTEDSYMGIYNY